MNKVACVPVRWETDKGRTTVALSGPVLLSSLRVVVGSLYSTHFACFVMASLCHFQTRKMSASDSGFV